MSETRTFDGSINDVFSHKFTTHMQQAMVTSAYKYGSVRDGRGGVVGKVMEKDMVREMRYRLKQYEETGRTEFLVDIANYAMIEFMKLGEDYVAEDSQGDAYQRE